MMGFYLEPADACAGSQFAFAAGVVAVSCIDAIARIRFGDGVGSRFEKFVHAELPSFAADGLAARFYDEFRGSDTRFLDRGDSHLC
jgi:hypothetical protein